MQICNASPFDRLIAAFCVALMMFYAATAPVRASDQIQHGPAFMASHDHGSLGGLTVDVLHGSHVDDHGDTPDDENAPSDHLAGGHHHHGDSGPTLLVPNGATAAAIIALASQHAIGKDQQITGLRPVGPERPPRSFSLTA